MTNLPELLVSDTERDGVVVDLRRHHVDGRLTLEEFSRRAEHAYAARTRAQLDELLRDLPAAASEVAPRPRRAFPLTVSVFAHVARRARRRVPRFQLAVAVFGSIALDLRDVVMDEPEATIIAFSVFGACAVTLPPAVAGELDGIAVFGTNMEHGLPVTAPGVPRVRMIAVSVFGSTFLRTRGGDQRAALQP
jgi:hypothetical protein